jgi:hypothetical protein
MILRKPVKDIVKAILLRILLLLLDVKKRRCLILLLQGGIFTSFKELHFR